MLESALQLPGGKTRWPEAQPSRADLGLADQSRQLPHRIAFVCFSGDAVVVLGCLLFAFWLRFHTALREFGPDAKGITLSDYYIYIVFGLVSLLVVLAQRRMYDGSWLLHRHSNLKHLIVACLLWGAGFLWFSLFFKFQPPLSRVYAALATVSAITGLCAWRRLLYGYLERGAIAQELRQRILVVGWTPYAQQLKEVFDDDPSHPYEIVFCVPTPDGKFEQEPPQSIPRAGSYHQIRRLLDSLALDVVLVADSNFGAKHWEALASLCEKALVQFKVIPSYFSILVSGLHLETTSGIPILSVSRLPLDCMFNKLLKRVVDIVGALVGLLLSVPLIAIFGALVYLESRGPIFYRQR